MLISWKPLVVAGLAARVRAARHGRRAARCEAMSCRGRGGRGRSKPADVRVDQKRPRLCRDKSIVRGGRQSPGHDRGNSADGVGAVAGLKGKDEKLWRVRATRWIFEPRSLSRDAFEEVRDYFTDYFSEKKRKSSSVVGVQPSAKGFALVFTLRRSSTVRTLYNFLHYQCKASGHKGFRDSEWIFSVAQDQDRADMPQESASPLSSLAASGCPDSKDPEKQSFSAVCSAARVNSLVAFRFWKRDHLELRQMKADWGKHYESLPEAEFPPIRRDGAFGEVKLMRRTRDGELVIAKIARDQIHPREVNQQVLLLELFDHPNVVKLLDWWCVGAKHILIFERVGQSLRSLQQNSCALLPKREIQSIMRQLLAALVHIHSRLVIHNGISPAHVLLDRASDRVCLVDFGSSVACIDEFASGIDCRTASSVQEAPLWYRPPEVLLGFVEPDFAIDVWSSGVLLGHLILGSPLFPGTSEVDMIMKIFEFHGRPSSEFWKSLPLWSDSFPNFQCTGPPDIFEDRVGSDGLGLFKAMCCLNRMERAPTSELLTYPFFAEVLARPLGSEEDGGKKPATRIWTAMNNTSKRLISFIRSRA